MACCRKDLDRAIVHAEKAVSLNLESPGYRDTLAEALFQKGDKAKATQAIQKAVDMDPKRVYYRRQLERISAGNPAAPRPDENDDE
jgi:tetratricopeptide (TPR) repeat protein